MTLREFALKYGLDAQELFEILVFEKFPIATIEDDVDDRVAEYLLEYVSNKKNGRRVKGQKKAVDSKKGKTRFARPESNSHNSRSENSKQHEAPVKCMARAMSVSEFAHSCKLQPSQVISYWLSRGKLYPLGKELTIEEVVESAAHFSIKIDDSVAKNCSIESAHNAHSVAAEKAECNRMPIVVVVGHVDHGKTSLLDYIRKTAVASGEKGGITQHIGAYKAHVDGCGDVVFIDTPGHEAFVSMREQGLAVADIAVLVVAADDGIKPQTIEAIKAAKSLGLMIVVALTKIDKVGQKEVDNVYQQLAEYELTPEAWGGSVTCIHVSSVTGEGISQLLEFLCLASEILDLRANMNVPGAGYVLEAKQEKGRGVVATVILQHGKLSVGDSFYSGAVFGRVMSIVDSASKNLSEVGPSEPVQVSGFSNLPAVGVPFNVASAHDARQRAAEAASLLNRIRKDIKDMGATLERTVNILIKADTSSSLQAVTSAVNKMKATAYRVPIIVASSVGKLTESDVSMAATTKSIIFMLHVDADNDILIAAKSQGVEIRSFVIIYDLFESLSLLIDKVKEPKVNEKKMGEALVLKVFTIKSIGTIAGIKVTSGLIKLGLRVVVIRGKEKIFSGGSVRTLQKEREEIKEAGKGHECAFSVDKFSQWIEGDIVEFYYDTPA